MTMADEKGHELQNRVDIVIDTLKELFRKRQSLLTELEEIRDDKISLLTELEEIRDDIPCSCYEESNEIISVNCDHVGLDVMIEEVGASNNGEYCDLHVTYITKKTAYWHEHIKMNGNCYELKYRNDKLVSICLLEPKWDNYEIATIGKCLIQESGDLILVKNGWIRKSK